MLQIDRVVSLTASSTKAAEALARGFDERAAVIEASPSTDDEHEERQAASFIRRAVRP
jgi:hypothetical protein